MLFVGEISLPRSRTVLLGAWIEITDNPSGQRAEQSSTIMVRLWGWGFDLTNESDQGTAQMQKEINSLKDKFRGALLGVAIGDALGAPYEGRLDVDAGEFGREAFRIRRLRYTDDTHMTIGLARSLLEMRGFDGQHMARVFTANFENESWRGYGAGPPQVFNLIQAGVSWREAARSLFGGLGSYGNGAAMRVAPVALFAYPDLDRVAQLARQSASVTHAHPLAIDGAVVQACAVAKVLSLTRNPRTRLDPLQPTLGDGMSSRNLRIPKGTQHSQAAYGPRPSVG